MSILSGFGLVAKKIGSKDLLKGGASDPVGGDFLWKSGKLVWCHRMRITTDHTCLKKFKKSCQGYLRVNTIQKA
jgi:hypothetical protein